MSTTFSSKQHEMQTIREIQQHIVSLLYSDEVWESEEQDQYLQHVLTSIIQKRHFWSYQLILVPIDNDFLRLAYKIILAREPDRAGLSHFSTGMSAGTMSRTDVINSMMRSPEFDKYGASLTAGGERLFLMLHAASQLLRKVPILNSVNRFFWRLVTGSQRARRKEFLLMMEMQEELNELKQRSIDMNEYLHNQEKCRGASSPDMANKVRGI
jgi:hypothetical protein